MEKKLLLRVILLSALALSISFILRRVFNVHFTQVEELVKSFGILGPLVYGTIFYLGLTIPFNPVSDFLVVNVAAFLFPPQEAVIATFIAHCLVLPTNYLVAKKYGNSIFKRITSKEENEYIKKLMKSLTPKTIFGLRFVLPTAHAIGMDIISYAAGIEGVNFPKFFVSSLIPWTILNVLYFYSASYFKHRSLILFFVPSIVLIAIPSIILLLKKINKK